MGGEVIDLLTCSIPQPDLIETYNTVRLDEAKRIAEKAMDEEPEEPKPQRLTKAECVRD